MRAGSEGHVGSEGQVGSEGHEGHEGHEGQGKLMCIIFSCHFLEKNIPKIDYLVLTTLLPFERREKSVPGISCVFWPSIWDGIWKQFCLDVPRSIVHFQKEIWDDPQKLYSALEEALGFLWSRWVCVFLNQACLADVYSTIFQHVQSQFGSRAILCEGKEQTEDGNYFSLISKVIYDKTNESTYKNEGNEPSLRLEISKNFEIIGLKKLYIVESVYHVSLFPVKMAKLTYVIL